MTTAVWLITTFLTKPESTATLLAFYRRTRPGRMGWKPIAALAPEVPIAGGFIWNILDWLAGCVLIYGLLFGTGKLILGYTGLGLGLCAMGLAAGAFIYLDLSRRGWSTIAE